MDTYRKYKYYENPDASVVKEEYVFTKINNEEKLLIKSFDRQIQDEAIEITEASYNKVVEARPTKIELNQKKSKELILLKEKAVKALENKGIEKELARVIVYG